MADFIERIEYRVVGSDGGNPSTTWFSSEEARESLVRCEEGWPEERPHRIQTRVVSESPWTDFDPEKAAAKDERTA